MASGNVHIRLRRVDFIFSVKPHELDSISIENQTMTFSPVYERNSVHRVQSSANSSPLVKWTVKLSCVRRWISLIAQDVEHLHFRRDTLSRAFLLLWEKVTQMSHRGGRLLYGLKHPKHLRSFKRRHVEESLLFLSFLLLQLQHTSVSDWLCSQLIKFYRSHFEWPDKVECGLDWACGFVTPGAYVPGLGLVECPGEHSCQFDCFQDRASFTFFRFYTMWNLPFFSFSPWLNSELERKFTQRFHEHFERQRNCWML